MMQNPFVGVSPEVALLAGVLATVLMAVLATLVVKAATRSRNDEEWPPRDEDGELPDEVELQPPTLRGSRLGIIGEVMKTWRYLNKTEKLGGKGYVRWYCVDDTFPAPRFIKPEDKGAGLPEYEHGGGVYLFPRDAAKPSAENGMWTYVHQRGDPEPINVHDHREEVMTAEQAKEWLTQGVSADRPSSGLFDFFGDLSTEQMLTYGIIAIVVFAVLFNRGAI